MARIYQWLTLVSVIITIFISPLTTFAQARFDNFNVDQDLSAMVIEGHNGQILFEQNTDKLVEVGDLSKLLTLYLVMDAVKQGNISMDTEVPISDQAFYISQNYDINNVPLRQDYPYKVEDLIQAVVIQSANGATLALAQLIEPDEGKFVELMRQQLSQWHLNDFEIFNATGMTQTQINDSYAPYTDDREKNKEVNRMSTEVVATIVYHLMDVYPDILNYSQKDVDVFVKDSDDAFDMNNANLLVSGGEYNYDLADGLMVDDSHEAQASIVATAEKDGLRVIGISLGQEDPVAMYQDMIDLFNQSFSAYRLEAIAKAGDPADHINQTRVQGGVETTTAFKYVQDFNLVVPIIDTAPQLSYEFLPDYQYFNPAGFLVAPVNHKTVVGQMQVKAQKSEPLASLPSAKGNATDIVVAEDIEEASAWIKFWRSLKAGFDDLMRELRAFFINLFN